MKEKGYQVIKGRGISFIDDKKVKVKGSELNFSLQTIERILEKQRSQGLKQPFILPPFSKQHTSDQQVNLKYENKPSSEVQGIRIQKGFSAMIDQVIKPEEVSEQANELLQQQKRKKKLKRSHNW